MKFDPPLLTEGGLSGRIYVVTHGKIEPHPTIEGETMIIASVKYDITENFEALVAKRSQVREKCQHERGTNSQGECIMCGHIVPVCNCGHYTWRGLFDGHADTCPMWKEVE